MDKINVSSEKVSSELAIFLFREDDNFIAYSPALDLSGYGKTEEDARNSFNIVLKEYFDYVMLTRPIILQTHISPVPEFIVKNTLRNLGITKTQFFDFYYKKK